MMLKGSSNAVALEIKGNNVRAQSSILPHGHSVSNKAGKLEPNKHVNVPDFLRQ